MNPFVAIVSIGTVAGLLGVGLVYLSVRRAGWYRRVAPWLGMAGGVAGVGVALAAIPAAMVVGALGSGPGQPTEEELARPVEGFVYRLVADDSEGALEDYRGSVVLLNLWATWCVPCVAELPYLNRLQEEYADRGLVVMTISNESRDKLLVFSDQHPRSTVDAYSERARTLPDPFRRAFRVLPTTYVIDRDGLIRAFFAGSRSYEQFAAMVRLHL